MLSRLGRAEMFVRLASPAACGTPTGMELVRKRSSVPSGSSVSTTAVRMRAPNLIAASDPGMRIEPGKSPAATTSGGSSGDFCVAASTFLMRSSSLSSQAGRLDWLSRISSRFFMSTSCESSVASRADCRAMTTAWLSAEIASESINARWLVTSACWSSIARFCSSMRRFCSASWADVLGVLRLAGALAGGFVGPPEAGCAHAGAAAPSASTSPNAAARDACRPTLPTRILRPALEQDIGPDREDGPRQARIVEAEVRARGRPVDLHHVKVEPPIAGAVRVEARAAAELPRIATELVEHVRGRGVDAELLRHDHVHRLGEHHPVDDALVRHRAGRREIRELAIGEFALEREAPQLRTGVERDVLVRQCVHRDAIRERVRLEREETVRESDLRVVRDIGERRVAVLSALAGRDTELGGELVMVLEVAETVARAELAGGGL